MIQTLSNAPYRMTQVPLRKVPNESLKTTVIEGDTVSLSSPGVDLESQKFGLGPIVTLLVALCGEAALAMAKKLAQETGRALADVAREMIEAFHHKHKEEPQKALAQVERAPRTLAILD